MNGTIAFDLDVCDRAACEELHTWADNEPFMAAHTPKYDPQKLIGMMVWQDFKRIDITMTQEEFITMVRWLNNEKNKLLRMRRKYDEVHGVSDR
jgi:hypothetical protein